MLTKSYTLHRMLILVSIIFWTESVYAVDFELRPRLESGAMIYSISQVAYNKTVLPRQGETIGHNKTQKEQTFIDTMGFIGCGTTLFYNHFFIDLSGQYAFYGKDQTSTLSSEYRENYDGDGVFFSYDTYDSAKFNRADYAISVGYAVTRRLSVFGGYKWAAVDLNNTYEGSFAMLQIDDRVGNGSIIGQDQFDFRYEGLFIGVTHGWSMGGAAQNMLSINLALAYLNSDYTINSNYIYRYESVNGQELDEPEVIPGKIVDTVKGDTLGVSLGINWIGTTLIKKLSYSVSIGGYRYSFDSERPGYRDIREFALSLKLGLSYAF